MRRIWLPQIIACLSLLWAFNPNNSYGYYILLRWICCAAFAYLAFHAFTQKRQNWGWVLGVTAAIYNPIMLVHLTREIWSVINVITIVLAVVSIFIIAPKGYKDSTA